jgi:hypothetical protein
MRKYGHESSFGVSGLAPEKWSMSYERFPEPMIGVLWI